MPRGTCRLIDITGTLKTIPRGLAAIRDQESYGPPELGEMGIRYLTLIYWKPNQSSRQPALDPIFT